MKRISHQLQQAVDEGLLEDKNTLKGVLESIARDFHVKKNVRRYQAPFKLFLEVIMLWGGPRLATFVALNFCGPEVHSIYRWHNQHRVHLEGGIKKTNFEALRDVYKQIMEKLGLSSVPVLAAEDETAIIGQVSYSEATDELLGFCGIAGPDHECLEYFTITVGEGEAGYNIVTAFSDCKIGSYARAVLLNPVHPNLPRFAILTMPTCNKFDTDFVQRQWNDVQQLYQHILEPTIGPLIGNSSDGDSRRRKLMLQLASSDDGVRFKPIPSDLGFVFSCRRENREDGRYLLRGMCDQDYVHNHKKLLNPLDHATRILMMGDYLVHMNHLQLIYDVLPCHDHGLGVNDINRRDRQN